MARNPTETEGIDRARVFIRYLGGGNGEILQGDFQDVNIKRILIREQRWRSMFGWLEEGGGSLSGAVESPSSTALSFSLVYFNLHEVEFLGPGTLVGPGIGVSFAQAVSGGSGAIRDRAVLGVVPLGLALEAHTDPGLYKLDLAEAFLDGGTGPLINPLTLLWTDTVDNHGKE